MNSEFCVLFRSNGQILSLSGVILAMVANLVLYLFLISSCNALVVVEFKKL